jgi:hypothetical protein
VKTFKFQLWQDGIEVASVEAASSDDACREIMHYAMLYGRDGPCEIRGDGAEKLFAKAIKDNPPRTGLRPQKLDDVIAEASRRR